MNSKDMKKLISKEFLQAIAVDLILLLFFGIVVVNLRGLQENLVRVYFSFLALINICFYFKYKKNLRKKILPK
jgi:hypothetical protein